MTTLTKLTEQIQTTQIEGNLSLTSWQVSNLMNFLSDELGEGPVIPEDLVEWTLDKSKGSLSKRITNAWFKFAGKPLSKDTKLVIDNLISEYANQTKSIFTYDIDPDVTEDTIVNFGNSSSCWKEGGDYSQSSTNFRSMGGFGLRFYDSDGKGSGRVWALAVTQDGQVIPFNDAEEINNIVTVNYYGVTKADVAKLLAKEFGFTYTGEVRLSIDNNFIYFNDYKGDYFGKDVCQFSRIDESDFEFEGGGERCSNCGIRVYDDSSYYVDDQTLCEYCYLENYSWCQFCEENHHINSMTDIDDLGHICEDCRDSYISQCVDCEKHLITGRPRYNQQAIDNYFVDDDGYTRCEDCHSDYEEALNPGTSADKFIANVIMPALTANDPAPDSYGHPISKTIQEVVAIQEHIEAELTTHRCTACHTFHVNLLPSKLCLDCQPVYFVSNLWGEFQ